MPYNVSEPEKRQLKSNSLEAIRMPEGKHLAGAWRFQRPDGRTYLIIGGIDVEQVDAILGALYLAKCDGFGESQENMRQALGL
jgi:hypothetical protein